MNEKQIEPTDAMVQAAKTMMKVAGADARATLSLALNHPDTRGLFAAGDDCPWEPLSGGPVRVGDEVRRDANGITRIAVVAFVDAAGDPWTAEGVLIGRLNIGTWYVRRASPELPTADGAVIIPADGREFIEQVGDCAHYRRLAYDAASGRWIGWDTLNHEADALFPRHITPGTWQVAYQ